RGVGDRLEPRPVDRLVSVGHVYTHVLTRLEAVRFSESEPGASGPTIRHDGGVLAGRDAGAWVGGRRRDGRVGGTDRRRGGAGHGARPAGRLAGVFVAPVVVVLADITHLHLEARRSIGHVGHHAP